VLALLADADFAEEWSTTTHPTHIVLKIAAIYNEHKAAVEDLWNDDAAMQACIEDVEEHADLVDYINGLLRNAEFVECCAQGEGL
jgi:hypothetical protein